MTDTSRFRGSGAALLTPFDGDGGLDLESFRALVDRQIEEGTDFLVPCGSTGEAVTLTPAEQETLVRETVNVADGRVAVVAGVGSSSTVDALVLADAARDAGADAVLAGCPPYNRPPQEGLFRHVQAVAGSAGLPVIVYNVPSRTSVNLLPDTALRLAELDGVIGIKEASGDLQQISTILRDRPDGFLVIAGDDELTLPILALGGDGSISVIANQVPGAFSRLVHLALAGDLEGARAIHYRLMDLMRANFVESNPIPAKAGMATLGLMSDAVRSPLVSVSDEARRVVEEALEVARGGEGS